MSLDRPEGRIHVAAWQAPLAPPSQASMLGRLREQVDRCERLGVEMLCCPEAILGGLADYADRPFENAIDVGRGGLTATAQALASESVTTIVGFTEVDPIGRLFNAAAVLSRGRVAGVYRKRHPAINHSIYHAGTETPVFTAGSCTFGIVICRDSAFPEITGAMVSQGAMVLFIPTNNGMPPSRGGAGLVEDARNSDIAQAMAHQIPVIRADVAGETQTLVSYGSSGIIGHDGQVLAVGRPLHEDLLVAEIDVRCF